jgi:hypothetical protein
MTLYDRIIRARSLAKAGDLARSRDLLHICEEQARSQDEQEAIARAWHRIDELLAAI